MSTLGAKKQQLKPLVIQHKNSLLSLINKEGKSSSPEHQSQASSPKTNYFFPKKETTPSDYFTPQCQKKKEKIKEFTANFKIYAHQKNSNNNSSNNTNCSLKSTNSRVKDGSPLKLCPLKSPKGQINTKNSIPVNFSPRQRSRELVPKKSVVFLEKINFQQENILEILKRKIDLVGQNKKSDQFNQAKGNQLYISQFFKEVCQLSISELEQYKQQVLYDISEFIQNSFQAFENEILTQKESYKKNKSDLKQQVKDLEEKIVNISNENNQLSTEHFQQKIESEKLLNIKLLNNQLMEQQKISQYQGIQCLTEQNQELNNKIDHLIMASTKQNQQEENGLKTLQLSLIKEYEIQKSELHKSIIQLEKNLVEYNEKMTNLLQQQNTKLSEQSIPTGKIWLKQDEVQQMFLLIKEIYIMQDKKIFENNNQINNNMKMVVSQGIQKQILFKINFLFIWKNLRRDWTSQNTYI